METKIVNSLEGFLNFISDNDSELITLIEIQAYTEVNENRSTFKNQDEIDEFIIIRVIELYEDNPEAKFKILRNEINTYHNI